MKIKKVLIANRGEIAIRIIQTCRDMGISTVAIYTENEKGLPHTMLADESYSLGEGPLSDTYLNTQLILDIARQAQVQAIHPGYGFLSEQAGFADAVADDEFIFIGPPSSVITLMGDKRASKLKMEEIGAPLIPGYHGKEQDPDLLLKQASTIGYPLLIKASAGGGGKGMRIVKKEKEFHEALAGAKREAQNAFGDDTVLLERFIQRPRHIEVQVMSDTFGNHVHLFERECSIQRRHQKIVEETPSVALSPNLRKKICETAVKIAREVGYVGAGTVEFILDSDDSFYFLEMNTRLQVEHPITEMVTGEDLVRWQLKIADGQQLPVTQEQITQRGHAIEVRLYAEDPDNEFLPQTGKILKVGELDIPGARLDSGYQDGNEVTINFDPMLAKLIVYGANRNQAIEKMQHALNKVLFLGVRNNRDYLKRILAHDAFMRGETFTHFVDTYKEDLLPRDHKRETVARAIAAFLLVEKGGGEVADQGALQTVPDIWAKIGPFRNT